MIEQNGESLLWYGKMRKTDEWVNQTRNGYRSVRRSVPRLASALRGLGDEGTENLFDRKANGCETESTVRGAAGSAGADGSDRGQCGRRARGPGDIYV